MHFAKLSCIIHALDEACSHIKNGQAWLAETFEYRDVDLLATESITPSKTKTTTSLTITSDHGINIYWFLPNPTISGTLYV